ncbi:MAG: glycoside hydrolase family 2 TIM barrel-domain containing protein [Chitinophagaceae bacterium]
MMRKSFCTIFCSALLFASNIVTAAPVREWITLTTGWTFYFAADVRKEAPKETISIPHTWNAHDITKGYDQFNRTTGIYQHQLNIPANWKSKRLFLVFDGANSVADVLINQRWIGQHKGGYTRFSFEITNFIQEGNNTITVQVSNAYRTDVLPLSGDFNIYGGLHRPVSLLVTGADCITPLDYASPGVYIRQQQVSNEKALLNIVTRLSLSGKSGSLQVRTRITDAHQQTVAQQTTTATAKAIETAQSFTLPHPHLWNAKADPYLYTATVELLQQGKAIDSVTQQFGLRYYTVDPAKGFFLNGKYLDLHGVGIHEDVYDKGSALDKADFDNTMQLLTELGATAVRLTHYPHSNALYDLCDRNGIVVWSEIPFVGPGGYTGPGYVKSPALEQHARQVLTELIRQYYNHPSICFWGLFNELKFDYDDPVPFVKELNALAKKEDPTRLTTCASFLDKDTFNTASDLIAWNKYYGWYGGHPEDIGTWADKLHKQFPAKPIGVSEYGAGASIYHHYDSLAPIEPTGRFHAEEWQTYYHEKNWEAMSQRPFLWGKFIWVLTDFGSSIRTEGDTIGINDKGLVTYDRKTKKDAFWFYKANWNPEPMLYLTDRRNIQRKQKVVTISVYTNTPGASLYVNGKLISNQQTGPFKKITWQQVSLQPGNNKIEVRSIGSVELKDSCEWEVKES